MTNGLIQHIVEESTIIQWSNPFVPSWLVWSSNLDESIHYFRVFDLFLSVLIENDKTVMQTQ